MAPPATIKCGMIAQQTGLPMARTFESSQCAAAGARGMPWWYSSIVKVVKVTTSRTRAASYPDRETAQRCTQEVVTRNEQVIHRWLAQGTRKRLTIEAAWPSNAPVGRVVLQAMTLAGREAIDVYAARVILQRDPSQPNGFRVHGTFPVYI